ncbi:MAG: restriction endonuclease subunit M, partial [Phycisphaerales bacterium]
MANDQPAKTNLQRAFDDKHLRLEKIGKTEKIVYVAANVSEKWSDPEEKVRAAFFADLIYLYQYKPETIGVEVRVPDRTPHDAADLVVFADANQKTPYAVIECKRDGVSDAEFLQAVEQVCGNGTWAKFRAKYVGVVAGKRRRYLDFTGKYELFERATNIIADLPRAYGKPEEYKFRKGGGNGFRDITEVPREELQRVIDKCHQTLWGGGKMSPPAAFGELCKILFVKNLDERQTKRGEFYQFQIKTHEKPDSLGARIRAVYAEAQRQDPDVFTETIKIDDAMLYSVVEHLEAVSLSKTDLDTKGVAFERFMDEFFKGNFGQYFTPREIISFSVEMIRPEAHQTVLDPACGSGGFLLHALDFVRHRATAEFPNYEDDTEEAKDHFRYWHDFAKNNLYGIEVNDEIARVAKMNMIIHDDGHTNISGYDALESFDRLKEANRDLKKGAFDIVLTNPPFGAMVKATEKSEGYLTKFELSRYAGKGDVSATQAGEGLTDSSIQAGKRAIKARSSVKTEILFIEQVYNFLKPGTGRAAIVLPDGILTNSSLQGVRDWMLEKFKILAVVSLPQHAFAHFGAGVKASVLFLERRAAGVAADDNEAIFMAAPENIGYDATGRKTMKPVSRTRNGNTETTVEGSELYHIEVVRELVG